MFALIVTFSFLGCPGGQLRCNGPMIQESVSVTYYNTHAICREVKRDTIRQNAHKKIIKSAECWKKSP